VNKRKLFFDRFVPDERDPNGVRPGRDAVDRVRAVGAGGRAVVRVEKNDVGPGQGAAVRIYDAPGERGVLLRDGWPSGPQRPRKAGEQYSESVAYRHDGESDIREKLASIHMPNGGIKIR
jgi:hypothetical protein